MKFVKKCSIRLLLIRIYAGFRTSLTKSNYKMVAQGYPSDLLVLKCLDFGRFLSHLEVVAAELSVAVITPSIYLALLSEDIGRTAI